TISKPNAKARNVAKDLDIKTADKELMGGVKKLMSTFMGLDEAKFKLEDMPIKRLKLTFSFDDASSAKDLKMLRQSAKSKVPDVIKSEYLTGSVLTYKTEDEEEIQRAFLRGLVLSEPNKLSEKDLGNMTKQWAEHRRVYHHFTKTGE